MPFFRTLFGKGSKEPKDAEVKVRPVSSQADYDPFNLDRMAPPHLGSDPEQRPSTSSFVHNRISEPRDSKDSQMTPWPVRSQSYAVHPDHSESKEPERKPMPSAYLQNRIAKRLAMDQAVYAANRSCRTIVDEDGVPIDAATTARDAAVFRTRGKSLHGGAESSLAGSEDVERADSRRGEGGGGGEEQQLLHNEPWTQTRPRQQ